jgi:ABC-type nitrate/sulfonate/bicarbonate transport system substrate-binding protein
MRRFVVPGAALAGRLVLAVALIVGAVLPAGAQNAPDRVRMALNPQSAAFLPIYWAFDRGYFTEQHLDVQITKISGSSLAILPSLARGDLDIAPLVVGPGFFNQAAAGFALKFISSIDQAEPDWHDTGCILVRQDLWASGAIRKIADLKGKLVDGGVDGIPQNYLLKQAILRGGLQLSDMTFTEKYKTATDQYAALRNKAVDVTSGAEPVCTQMQVEGLTHKWLTFQDVVPGLQGAFLTTSAAYLKDHRDVVKRFLLAFLKAERDLKRTNGKWTPAVAATMASWSGLPIATIELVPGPPYTGQFGLIDIDSIITQEQFWLAEGSVKQRVSATDLIDISVLTEARRELGMK